ncbi:Glutamine-rich protein 2 [Acipenser ruthenus]|uniref:Glutamine-rich protein 2 n=1 Tax=Acipenser ruthenus TaxID=7906 RepID=A0A444UET0_ACIRT|nr:Glutamine-rich protein 2 [Acipenser ruthenus]
MPSLVSLYELANLSIGTPEVGAVNFNALHSLLHAILGHLNIQDVKAELRTEDHDFLKPAQGLLIPAGDGGKEGDGGSQEEHRAKASPYHSMEKKLLQMEMQMSALSQLPGGGALLERTKESGGGAMPVSDMWQMIQMKRKVEANEEGVTKAMALMHELMKEINELKKSRDELQVDMRKANEKLSTINMNELMARLDNLDNLLHAQQERMSLYPSPEDLGNLVSWGELQESLMKEKVRLEQEVKDPQHQTVFQAQASTSPSPELQPSPNPQTPPHSSSSKPQSPHLSSRSCSSRASSGKDRYPETVEALQHVGQLTERHKALEERIARLEKIKADLTDLDQLRTEKKPVSIPDDLQLQLANLKESMEKCMADREKLDLMQNFMDSMEELRRKVEAMEKESQKLREVVEQTMSETGVHLQSEGGEALTVIQNTILQLQAECQKLNITASELVEDHSKKQKHIDHLYESVDGLDKKKADKELVEMEIDVKADKLDLESKVSRMRFDATTEQLNKMFQELLNKMSGQESDWNKVIEKISMEMELKLNRMELDPLKKQLEDRWKSVRKQLQEAPQVKLGDAAGIRKQLVTRFNCISCARPVDMMVPPPHLVSISTGFPGNKTHRPYTVYELDNIRKHTRCLKPVTNQENSEVASTERRIANMRRIYSVMSNQIERVQVHFERGSRQGYMDRTGDSPRHDRIRELSDLSYLGPVRSCGGSHTMTIPQRRYPRVQPFPEIILPEEEVPEVPVQSKEEIDILGLDGVIYKGRLDQRQKASMLDPRQDSQLDCRPESRLPDIAEADVNQHKLSRATCQNLSSYESMAGAPVRPQSARVPRSRSASVRLLRERPVSSLGWMPDGPSQTTPPTPTPPTSPLVGVDEHPRGLETLQLRIDMSQSGQEEPVTTL